MKKILIITDANGHSIKESLLLKYPKKPVKVTALEELTFQAGSSAKDQCIATNLSKMEYSDMTIEIYSLDHRHTDKFASHVEMLKNDYSDHDVFLFLGFHDLWILRWKFNPEETAYRYIESAKNMFNKFKVITPFRNLDVMKKEPTLEDIHVSLIGHIKEACAKQDIECQDIDVLLNGVNEDDYLANSLLKPEKCMPILSYMEI